MSTDALQPALEPEAVPDGRIRVVDDEGHLLFVYDPHTRAIEFVPVRGRRLDKRTRVLCVISTDELRSAGARNVISDSPIHTFVAEVRDVKVE